MIEKIINFAIDSDNSEIFYPGLEKTASEHDSFSLPDGVEYDPDFLYLKVRAITAGEYYGCNKNADYFSEEELKRTYKTFLNAHVFKNHENKKVEAAIGDVIDAIWDDEMKCVILFIRINRRIAPEIAAGFEKGYMTDVSMGCRVEYTICSICQNRAKTQKQYCEHILKQRHQVLSDGRRVFEININPQFHDISAVLNGADRTAKATFLFQPSSREKAASEFVNIFEKVASGGKNIDRNSTFEPDISFRVTEKVASENKSHQNGQEKLAEIKKRIQGNVMRVSNSESEIRKEKINNISDFNAMSSETIMPIEKIDSLANSIYNTARQFDTQPSKVLAIFLKICALNGKIFSPSEITGVMKRIVVMDRRELSCNQCNPEPLEFVQDKTKAFLAAPEMIASKTPQNVPSLQELFKIILHREQNKNVLMSKSPLAAQRMMIITTSKKPDTPLGVDPYQKVIKLADSFCEELEKTASIVPTIDFDPAGMNSNEEVDTEPDKSAPSVDPGVVKKIPDSIFKGKHVNRKTPTIKSFPKTATFVDDLANYCEDSKNAYEELEKIAYACYIENIANYIDSKDYAADLFLFEKTAKFRGPDVLRLPRTAITAGGIGAGGALYSRIQNVKARRGEELSPTNRAIAESPSETAGVAAGLGTVYGYNHRKMKNKIEDNVLPAAKEAAKNLKGKAAKGFQKSKRLLKRAEIIDDVLLKNADFNKEYNNNDIDMFKNESIDKELGKLYNDNEINCIKLATLSYAMGNEDKCDDILEKFALDYEDIETFLSVSSKHV